MGGRCRHHQLLFPLLMNFLSKFVNIFVVFNFSINQLDIGQILMRLPTPKYQNLIFNIMLILLNQIIHRVHCEAPLFVELTALNHLPSVRVLKIQALNSIDRVAIELTAFDRFKTLENIEVSAVLCNKGARVTSFKI